MAEEYETPRVTEYGGFEKITKGSGSKPGDEGSHTRDANPAGN